MKPMKNCAYLGKITRFDPVGLPVEYITYG